MSFKKLIEFINTNTAPYKVKNVSVEELKLFFLVRQAVGMQDDGKNGTRSCVVGQTELPMIHDAWETDKALRNEVSFLLSNLIFDLVSFSSPFLNSPSNSLGHLQGKVH